MRSTNSDYMRNIIFGAEDSLVSTVGVLFGLATTDISKYQIFLTGVIIIAVEATSMGVGAFLSEEETLELENSEAQINNGTIANPKISGVLMFLSYLLTGLIPLIPYIVFPIESAKYLSLILTLVALFALGYIPTKKIKSAWRMGLIGGIAVLVGFVIAHVANLANTP